MGLSVGRTLKMTHPPRVYQKVFLAYITQTLCKNSSLWFFLALGSVKAKALHEKLQ
jgi:hypothetical protein